jgi:hypothetical protein
MTNRKFDRFETATHANWDFYSAATGAKSGYIDNFSRGGCLLRSSENIEHQRWIRLMLKDEETNLRYTLVGRVVRCENAIEALDEESEITLYRYGIEFTYPGPLSSYDFDLILALSSRNLRVLSCLNRNSKSSFLPGFSA